MMMLCLGVGLFALAHLMRRLAPGLCAAFPDIVWKIIVAVLLVGSVYLMTLGWPEASTEILWTVPKPVQMAVVVLMGFAFILFFGTHPGSALRASIRHPQLTGFKLWATLHLIVNGDVRSVILFGGLLAWAVIEVILINRSGKPPLPEASNNTLVAWAAIPIGMAVWAGILLSHASLFGVSPLG